ncbi:MAG: thiol peroxidase [Verrucomicrobia bacterium]|nr:thiol peroxidase [Verrucomicrobiota bacterium]MCH8528693.1 thiol peroxidase [Kiritimatiellia bacterium]
MAKITFKGSPIHTCGELPATGSAAPDFVLCGGDLSDVSLSDFAGKTVILNIVPSLDTGVCQASARRFNEIASRVKDVKILNVSLDLPFAQGRFCGSENLNDVINLSAFRSPEFGKTYGVVIEDGPLAGLFSRAVVLIGADGKVLYKEQVPEIAQEPAYEAVLNLLG